jgi:hypothetical protein
MPTAPRETEEGLSQAPSSAPLEIGVSGTAPDVAASAEGVERSPVSVSGMPSMPDGSAAFAELQKELGQMLETAEGLQEKCDRLTTRVEFVNTVSALLFTLSLGAALYWLLTDRRVYAMMSGFGFLAVLIVFARVVSDPKRRLERDRRALLSIVALLRETEGAAAMQGLWTPFQLAQFRIRLARFDISPGTVEGRRRG